MTLTCKSEVKKILKKYNLRPSRGLGQNFLIDKIAIKRIIAAADLKLKDTVVEIGPGLGVLTMELTKKVKKVIAVEKDPNMCEILRQNLSNSKNIEIIEEDIRKITDYQLPVTDYKLIANLPFYLTAPVIRKFLEFENQPELMVLIIQKEVAQRIVAQPPKMNLLAVSVQFYTEPKIITYVSRKCFWPQPKVDAAIIKLKTICLRSKNDKDLFFKIVRSGFSQPRKMLINSLSRNLKIDKINIKGLLWKNNIQPNQRAETLSIKNWIKLSKSFYDND